MEYVNDTVVNKQNTETWNDGAKNRKRKKRRGIGTPFKEALLLVWNSKCFSAFWRALLVYCYSGLLWNRKFYYFSKNSFSLLVKKLREFFFKNIWQTFHINTSLCRGMFFLPSPCFEQKKEDNYLLFRHSLFNLQYLLFTICLLFLNISWCHAVNV